MDGSESDDDEDEGLGPGDADYDLSEEHGYLWDPEPRRWLLSRPLLVFVSLLAIIGLVLPAILLIFRAG